MASRGNRTRTQSWAEEPGRLSERLRDKYPDMHLDMTYLSPGWDTGRGQNDRWQKLRNERDRVSIIKTDLGWLSFDAAARVDRNVHATGKIIEGAVEGGVSEAALNLRQAEHIMQRAWWSRFCNNWGSPWMVPMWAVLSILLVASIGATVWTIVSQELFPRGEPVPLSEALFGAVLWGFGGALVNALRTLHLRVQKQEFERERVAWYLLSPVIGLTLGAIVFLLFLGGLLSTGQELGAPTNGGSDVKVIGPTAIFLLAVLAGLAQNTFVGALEGMSRSRFQGSEEEEESGG